MEERSGLWHKQAQIQSETSKIEFENKDEGNHLPAATEEESGESTAGLMWKRRKVSVMPVGSLVLYKGSGFPLEKSSASKI